MNRLSVYWLFPLLVASAFATEYQDTGRSLRFSLPDGYQKIDAKQPEVVAAWLKRGKEANDLWFLSLSQINGLIAKGEMPKSAVPRGWSAEMVDWHGEKINCLRFHEKTPQATYVDLQVIFPASPNALRLTFGALDSSEAELRKVMAAVVETVQVPVSYRENVRSHGLVQIIAGLAGIAAITIVIWWVRRVGAKR